MPGGRAAEQDQMRTYMESHGIRGILEDVNKEVLIHRPHDPVEFMIERLRGIATLQAGPSTTTTAGDVSQGHAQQANGRVTLRVAAEFHDEHGSVTKAHLQRTSARPLLGSIGQAKRSQWFQDVQSAVGQLTGGKQAENGSGARSAGQARKALRDNAPLVVQSENGELGAARQDQGQGLKRRVLRGIMESIGCSEILASCVPVRAGGDGSEVMLELAELPRDAILEAFQDAAEQLGERVIAMIEAWRTDAQSRAEHGIAGGSGGKFVEGQYGGLEMFHMGLDGLIGLPDAKVLAAMKREHASTTKFSPSNNKDIVTSDAEEWALMVIEDEHGAAVGVSNKDRAGNVMCADFTQHEMAIKAKLSLAEIIALRLYTGPCFQRYNGKLRALNPDIETSTGADAKPQLRRAATRRALDNPGERRYTTTIHAIASGLIKIAHVSKLPEDRKVYRGMAGVVLPERFRVLDEHGCRGGVELGFLSTSTDKDQALHYIDMSRGLPTLFEIELGQVDRGGDLEWASQFPTEKEVLLPPLSNLEVVGEPTMQLTRRGPVQVYKLRVNINLKGLTMDQLKERRRTLHLAMCDNLISEAEQLVSAKMETLADESRKHLVQSGLDHAMEQARELMQKQYTRSAEEFNEDSVYSTLLQEAVQVTRAGPDI